MRELHVTIDKSKHRYKWKHGYVNSSGVNRTEQSLLDKGYTTKWKGIGLGDYLIITSRLISLAKDKNVKVVMHYPKVKGFDHHERLGNKWIGGSLIEYRLYSDISEYDKHAVDCKIDWHLRDNKGLSNLPGYAQLKTSDTIIPERKYITYSLDRRFTAHSSGKNVYQMGGTIKQKNLILDACRDAGYKLINIDSFNYTLEECIDLLSSSSFHVTTEGGLAHLAACCGAPIILYKGNGNPHNKFLEESCNIKIYSLKDGIIKNDVGDISDGIDFLKQNI